MLSAGVELRIPGEHLDDSSRIRVNREFNVTIDHIPVAVERHRGDGQVLGSEGAQMHDLALTEVGR